VLTNVAVGNFATSKRVFGFRAFIGSGTPVFSEAERNGHLDRRHGRVALVELEVPVPCANCAADTRSRGDPSAARPGCKLGSSVYVVAERPAQRTRTRRQMRVGTLRFSSG
jgi:hypothetical protein